MTTKLKKKICKKDPNSKEILKPLLRGRNIGKYYYNWKGLWIISTFPSINIKIDNYPGVKKYLLNFGKKRLEQTGKEGARKKTSNKWFETQDNISYYKDFKKNKIIWQEIVKEPSFAWDPGKFYQEATSFIMTGPDVSKYLLGMLNSKLLGWVFRKIYGTELSQKVTRYKKTYLKRLPVRKGEKRTKTKIEKRVDKTLSITKDDDYLENEKKQEKVSKLQDKINKLVYDLYGLTDEEIKIVEESFEKN